ncbi:MAG: hypothetical protein SF182_09605 [Deltaproteobacteria bacterium]|nr:hypothetical protein [Deltaproteobacteria bacterium]
MSNRGLFEPDVLIAEQSAAARHRRAAMSGEKRLMLAVLQDAFETYRKYMLAQDRVGRALFDEAAAWIASTRNDGLFSFEHITETLEIEPSYFRRSLAAWSQRQSSAGIAAEG